MNSCDIIPPYSYVRCAIPTSKKRLIGGLNGRAGRLGVRIPPGVLHEAPPPPPAAAVDHKHESLPVSSPKPMNDETIISHECTLLFSQLPTSPPDYNPVAPHPLARMSPLPHPSPNPVSYSLLPAPPLVALIMLRHQIRRHFPSLANERRRLLGATTSDLACSLVHMCTDVRRCIESMDHTSRKRLIKGINSPWRIFFVS